MDYGAKGSYVVVIGANGLVGRRVGKLLTGKKIRWVGTFNKRYEEGLIRLDITDRADVEGFFSRFSAEAVFFCANLAGGVDFCERNPKMAADFHLNAVRLVSGCCSAVNALFVFLSTDYVFDGTKGPYGEDDLPCPMNLYGRLKLEAENWIRDNVKRHLIIRTTNVYGWDPRTVTPNYMMSLYKTLTDGKAFNAPSFLWGNPTYVGDLAEAVLELYVKGAGGIFHVVGNSFVNRYEWARDAAAIFGLDGTLIRQIREPSTTMVPRPLRSWLGTDKFSKSYRTVLRDLSGGLKLMKRDMEDIGS